MVKKYKLPYTAAETDRRLGMVVQLSEEIEELKNKSSGADISIDATLSIEGQAADAKAVGDAFAAIPVSVSEDGYTDIYGLRQLTSWSVTETDSVVTIDYTLEGGEAHQDVLFFDTSGYPTSLIVDGVTIPGTWTKVEGASADDGS